MYQLLLRAVQTYIYNKNNLRKNRKWKKEDSASERYWIVNKSLTHSFKYCFLRRYKSLRIRQNLLSVSIYFHGASMFFDQKIASYKTFRSEKHWKGFSIRTETLGIWINKSEMVFYVSSLNSSFLILKICRTFQNNVWQALYWS